MPEVRRHAQEAQEHGNKKNPLRKLFIVDPPDGTTEPTMNLLLNHGVRSALEYAASGDLAAAYAVTNPELAPRSSTWAATATAS